MVVKVRYTIDLSSIGPIMSIANIRPVAAHDHDDLAGLMLTAYRGTIDDEGETLAEAKIEVNDYFLNQPLLDASAVISKHHQLVSACLVSRPVGLPAPLIAYAITTATHKKQGYGRAVLLHSLNSLQRMGYLSATAFITEGNYASEALCQAVGFRPIEI